MDFLSVILSLIIISTTVSRDSSNKISTCFYMDEVLRILFSEAGKKRWKLKHRGTDNPCPDQWHKTPVPREVMGAVWWKFPPCTPGKCSPHWCGETHQNCAGQAASTNTANLTRLDRGLTLQIILCGAQGVLSHAEPLPSGTSLCTHWALKLCHLCRTEGLGAARQACWTSGNFGLKGWSVLLIAKNYRTLSLCLDLQNSVPPHRLIMLYS